jgi:CysZ protein
MTPMDDALLDPRRGTVLHRFFRGLLYPWHGTVWLWSHRDLWPWATAPLLITGWMIAGALWLTVSYGDTMMAWVWAPPNGQVHPFAATLWWLAAHVLEGLLFLVLAVVLFVLGNMLASPFWDVLAERTEKVLIDRPETVFDLRVALGDASMSVRHSFLGIGLYLAVMLALTLLNLVPGVGTALDTILAWPATAFFVAREVMDIPLSRRRTPFVEKLRWMGRHPALLAGLGTSTMFLLAVPFLDLLVMPFAVMGGTLLYCHLHRVGEGVPQRGPGGTLPEAPA